MIDDDAWWGDDAELGLDLDAERAAPPPARAARERVLAGVMAHVATPTAPAGPEAPVDGAGAGPSASLSTTTTATGGSLSGWLVGALLLAAASGGLWWASDAPEPAAPRAAAPTVEAPAEQRPAPVAASAGSAPAEPTVEGVSSEADAETTAVVDAAPAPRAHRPTHRPRAKAHAPAAEAPAVASADAGSAPPPPSPLAREQALLAQARGALRRGDFAAADGAIGEHTQAFPDGQLAEAREVLRIQLLVRRGHDDEARATTRRFRQRFPDSLMGPALEDALRAPVEEQ